MNKYFNKILFSIFVISFFIIPAKTFASTIPFNIVPTGTDRNFSCPNPPDDGSTGTRYIYQDDGDDLPGAYSIFVLDLSTYNCATKSGGGEGWLPYNSAIGTDAFEYRRNVSGTDDYVSLPFYTVSGVVFSDVPSNPSQIVQDLPAESSTVAYNVTFSGTYTNADLFDRLIYEVNDLTDSFQMGGVIQLPQASGTDMPFSFILPLSPNHEFEYRFRLFDGTDYLDWTDYITFSTSALSVTTPAWEPETCDSIISDFSACVRNFVRETFYPNPESISQFNNLTLRNSVPFSYIYDIGNIYNELFNTESTQSMTITISTPIGNITLISASMISAIPLASTIKTVLGWLIYLFTAFTIYRIIINRTHS